MQVKAQKRTRDRILDAALRAFNTLGEPNVSLNTIADELGISTGNLNYHFRSKADIVVGLFDRFEKEWAPCDQRGTGSLARFDELERLHRFVSISTRAIWQHRFLFRDLNELASRNRRLEMRFIAWVGEFKRIGRERIAAMIEQQMLQAPDAEIEVLLDNLVMLSCYWLSHEALHHARRFADPGFGNLAVARGRRQVLALFSAHLSAQHRPKLAALLDADTLACAESPAY